MSQSAFSLLSNGLKFKGVKENEKDIFKKGSMWNVDLFTLLEYLKTSSTKNHNKTDIPSSIDLFNYNSAEYVLSNAI